MCCTAQDRPRSVVSVVAGSYPCGLISSRAFRPRPLLEIVVYDRHCRIDGKLTLDDPTETEIGDWTMPDFRAACAYTAS